MVSTSTGAIYFQEEVRHYNLRYSRRQYKVSVTYRLPTVPYLKKTPNGRVEEHKQSTDCSGTSDYKSRNNSVDGLERTWPEEKRLIDQKSRNNR